MKDVASGSFTLIAEGVARHEGEKREQWFAVIKRLTGLDINLLKQLPNWFSEQQLETIHHGKVVIKSSSNKKNVVTLFISVPSTDKLYLSAEITDFNEQLSRIAALLILNELGRHPKEQRNEILEHLQRQFGFPLAVEHFEKIELDYAQQRRIIKGDIVVVLNDTTSDKPFIQVFAKYGNSGQLLTLGPIPLFNWFPRNIILLMVLIGITSLGLCSYALVRPLEKRLKVMEVEVDKIGSNLLPSMPTEGDDAISQFAKGVNNMALRIQALLDEQKELTHAISHELRTPVARLKFRLEALAPPLDEEKFNRVHEGFSNDLNELSQLIDEILTFASLKNDKNVIEQQRLNLSHLIGKLIADTSMLHSHLDISLQNHSKTQVVIGIEYLLQRALQNLVLNAARYAKEKIIIEFFNYDDRYELKVHDDGIGIPESDWERVFIAFARMDESRTRASGGFGLGLAIVQQVARLHHGKVAVTKSRLGGAEFTFCWPK